MRLYQTLSAQSNQTVYPFENSKFVIAASYFIDATDYKCIHESTLIDLYQYKATRNENGDFNREYEFYDLESCSNEHFTDKEFEDYPILKDMQCISSDLSLTGSALSK